MTAPTTTPSVIKAYSRHYENFPVASILLPRAYRQAIRAIYAFARSADDIADEGNDTAEQRLSKLKQYEWSLDCLRQERPQAVPAELQPIFSPLFDAVQRYQLPLNLLADLLDAFKQDVTTTRYATYTDLLDYCRRSANPIGRLLLHLYQVATPDTLQKSDAICTALQLINFWQDVAIDWQKSRIYLPQADMRAFGVEEWDIGEQRAHSNWYKLMWFEVKRTRALLLSGAELTQQLPGRAGFELRLVILGGLTILKRLEQEADVFRHRPRLRKSDWLGLCWRACRWSRPLSA
ncbi:squalene synthase HpnC [Parvibium lacunae]|uniref:Squalene synthase HpnC n=1 Tax=Parvibium lacunae TaxID=1888893 RepID=A0A368L880_9BURK|nr:squalene synthase HpnC [Parvibium lacunae]RCS59817.1 squalene synthase HpnC [Parvibium lacunae]